MRTTFLHLLLLTVVVAGSAMVCRSQGMDMGKTPTTEDGIDHADAFKENFERMRIEKLKKDHEQMVEKGEEALKITTDLRKAVDTSGKLSDKERSELLQIEKLAKQIRSDLGGSDDGDDEDLPKSGSVKEAAKDLMTSSQKLYDELKKTTRFTISAAAIESSNAVLRLSRYLKTTN